MGCIHSSGISGTSQMDLAFRLARGNSTTDECLERLEKFSRTRQVDDGFTTRVCGDDHDTRGRTRSRKSRHTYTFEYAAVSKAGADHTKKRKTNQDSFLISTRLGFDRDISIYGVFDGHGPEGHLVSRYVRDNLEWSLLQEPLLSSDPEGSIRKALARINQGLDQRDDIDTSLSGTTCVFLLRVVNTLYCVNIGDSRAVLAKRMSCVCPKSKSPYQYVDLSHDHNLDNRHERQRIIEAGGVVQSLPGGPGPLRVWLPTGHMPGLAMSRSLGDKIAHLVGVSNEPDIVKHLVSDRDEFIVLASDGVWEFLSSEDTIDFISTRCKHWENLGRTVDRLCDMALLQWCTQQENVDDITVIVLRIRHHDADAAA